MIKEVEYIKKHIADALKEDVGNGDCSSLCCIGAEEISKAKLIAKEDGVICGIDIARMVFEAVDKEIQFGACKVDGDKISKGDKIFSVFGSARSILTAERTALNYIQRLSGIATQTAEYVKLIQDTNACLLDTRKTTPTLRLLEKYAVKIGGGHNHRFGLFDMIMLKDNHVDFAGGIEKAIEKAYAYVQQKPMKIEIEVRNFTELEEVLRVGKVDRIMLDNFSFKNLAEAIKMIGKRYETEASGGITKETVRDYALTGVDFISVGALTHHIQSLDLSLVAAK